MGREILPRPTVGGRTHLGLALQVPGDTGALRQEAGQLPGTASIGLCPHLVPPSAQPPHRVIGGGDRSLALQREEGRDGIMLGHHGTFDAWLHTLYFGMSLPGSMVRSARSIGLIAGGAAGGPPGIAAATAAAAATNTAANTASSAAQNATPRSQGP